jgi:clan AA aspartic protease (TIGR02281 family)
MVADYAGLCRLVSNHRTRVVNRSTLALCGLVVAGAPSLGAAQTLSKCTVGQAVTDREDKTGIVISAASNLCQVKYPDGQIYGWIYWDLRPNAPPEQSGSPAADAKLRGAAAGSSPASAPANAVPLPTILRPGPSTHTLVYRANPRGQFSFTAAVNGASIRFLVDTGANLVMLTPEDARAAGIDPSALVFNSRAITANGVVRIAPVMLGEIRIEQLSIDNVAAAVQEQNLKQSLLGMSFLQRLKSFEMREGGLTISW